MFFLILVAFIVQVTIMTILVSSILNLDVKILLLTDKFEDINERLCIQTQNAISEVDKIKQGLLLIQINQQKKQLKFIAAQCLNILEWLLLFGIKRKSKGLLLGYKILKVGLKELSSK